MKEIPKMISTKDLSYIEDMMNWNMIYSKKAHMYKGMIQDKTIKQFVASVAKMHTEHFNKLLNILEKGI